MPSGRLCTYTEERGKAICEKLKRGETLLNICEDPDMPDRNTVYRWLDKYPDFYTAYSRARKEQMDTWADQIVTISDAATKETAQADRLRVDTRKFLMAKIAPKVYGDHTNLNVSGTLEHVARVDAPPSETRQQWLERKQAELTALKQEQLTDNLTYQASDKDVEVIDVTPEPIENGTPIDQKNRSQVGGGGGPSGGSTEHAHNQSKNSSDSGTHNQPKQEKISSSSNRTTPNHLESLEADIVSPKVEEREDED